MARKKDKGANLVKLEMVVHCNNLDEDVTVKIASYDIHASIQECELCGDHGKISTYYTCKCGNMHTITFEEW